MLLVPDKRYQTSVRKKKYIKGAFIGVIAGFLITTLILILNYLAQSSEDSKKLSNRLLMEALFRQNGSLQMSTDNTVASLLYEKVRVMCWILTCPPNHKTKAIHVKKTWGKRCNYLLFMSSEADQDLPAIELPTKEGRHFLWQKTREAFRYVYLHYKDKADWFLKADDDTYVIMENLRFLLSKYNSKEPIYFGSKFKPFITQGYMSGGAGYVLSKEALVRFVKNALPNNKTCSRFRGTWEDVAIGKCLEAVEVQSGDSRDSLGKGRFFPLAPTFHFKLYNQPFWYWNYIYYKPSKGKTDCCSDSAISFHYIDSTHMYLLDYFIYELKVFGININFKFSEEYLNVTQK